MRRYCRCCCCQIDKCLPAVPDTSADADAQSLSIIDTVGFSSVETNTFETFCVNYLHERMHQVFIDHVFKQEVGPSDVPSLLG